MDADGRCGHVPVLAWAQDIPRARMGEAPLSHSAWYGDSRGPDSPPEPSQRDAALPTPDSSPARARFLTGVQQRWIRDAGSLRPRDVGTCRSGGRVPLQPPLPPGPPSLITDGHWRG